MLLREFGYSCWRGLYAVLAGALILVGLSALFVIPELGGMGGWLGAAVFLLFTVVLYRAQDDPVTATT
ncbi:hypothetical protein [Cryobacterium sp. MLB-32]|uniref:hypothetical protein n=1 Tax=Cryobacterium sp. MLB-32 TaxID=1529318 RepID=UPI0012E0301B|nr:hypothetical protein [Cryobacterium sp. MLB-32]